MQTAPNPAGETVRISLTGTKPASELAGASFQLVAVGSGAVVRTATVPANGQLVLDVSQVPAGVYVGRVAGGSGVGANCKIVVVH